MAEKKIIRRNPTIKCAQRVGDNTREALIIAFPRVLGGGGSCTCVNKGSLQSSRLGNKDRSGSSDIYLAPPRKSPY